MRRKVNVESLEVGLGERARERGKGRSARLAIGATIAWALPPSLSRGVLALALLAPILAPLGCGGEAPTQDCPVLYEACHSTLLPLCLIDDRFCNDNGSFTGELLEHCLNMYEECENEDSITTLSR